MFQPSWLFNRLSAHSPEVLYSVQTQEPILALTIDDGPDPSTTPRILDLLLEHDARATFFFGEIHWFRPGSGWYNKSMRSVLIQHGYRLALGSIHPFDSHIPSSRFASNYILWRAQPGAIIVLHDNSNRGHRTADTLEKVLPALRARNFRFVTLTELSEQAQGED
jgi:peptidoglycan/xylan/chitin deacetylase (PgdA/CDA1 family)